MRSTPLYRSGMAGATLAGLALAVFLFSATACTRVESRLPGAPADPSGSYAVTWDGSPGALTLQPAGDARARGYPCAVDGDRVLGVGFWFYSDGSLDVQLQSLDGLTFVELRADVRGDQFEGTFAASIAGRACASGSASGVREP